MEAISSLELLAVAAWLLGAAFVIWARTARGLGAAEATILVVIMTVVPVLGPVVAIVHLWRSSGGGRRLRLVSSVRRRGDRHGWEV